MHIQVTELDPFEVETAEREAREFYAEALPALRRAEAMLLDELQRFSSNRKKKDGFDPIDHCKSRIKTPQSMKRKLLERGLPVDRETALTAVNDAVGVRVVCYFTDDIYRIVDYLKEHQDWEIVKDYDYVAHPKPNGYRSYHLVVRPRSGVAAGVLVEVQIRTLVIDCWASLEHTLKYKKSVAHEEQMRDELRRCANELASMDRSMLALRNLILKKDDSSDPTI